MSRLAPLAISLLVLGGTVFAACQSTQDKSAELAKHGDKLLKAEGLDIGQESSTVQVVDSVVLSDANGAAVAVIVKNDSARTLVNVPLLIDVRDAKGKSVFKNDTPGLDPSLTSIPLLQPGEEVFWVHDQVFPAGEPESVKVTVGNSNETAPPELPEIEMQDPELHTDPYSGVEAVGDISTPGDELILDTYVYAVARQGYEIVAAGRGLIDKLKPGAKKPAEYHIFFIGDPEGAELSAAYMPTNVTSEAPAADGAAPTDTAPPSAG